MNVSIGQWILENPRIVVASVVLILAIIFMYFNKKDLLYKAALYGVAKAEEAWGSGMGLVKFAEVYTYLKKEYPFVTFFFTEAQLSITIEMALVSLKEILTLKAKQEAEKQNNIIQNTLIETEPNPDTL